jgi:hypothetical protein
MAKKSIIVSFCSLRQNLKLNVGKFDRYFFNINLLVNLGNQ